MKYEYGVAHNSEISKGVVNEVHRWGMTYEEAVVWVTEWIAMGGNEDSFQIIKRAIGDWEVVE